MSATEETLTLLRSIDASLKLLVKQKAADAPKAIASDRDLDGKYGDPELKVCPRDWTGPSYKGRKFSECPPALLDLAAEMFDYFGRQADEKNERTEKGKPVGEYRRLDAAKARGWAKRIREGRHIQTTEPHADGFAGDAFADFGGAAVDDSQVRW